MVKIRLCCLAIWSILDPLYYFFTRLTYVEKKGVFRVRLTRYRGRTLQLSDGTIIKKNDLLVKIHLHNIRLIREMKDIDSDVKKALYIYKSVERSLPNLALYIRNHPKYNEIRGIIGISGLNKGVERLGFENFKIHNNLYKWVKLSISNLIYLLSTPYKTNSRIKRTPEYLLMSKESLLNQYLTQYSIHPKYY